MRKIVKRLAHWSPAGEWSPERRGSVLVLVVAILVLLALMGTAYVSTARIDNAISQTGVGGNVLLTGQSNDFDASVLSTGNATLTNLVKTAIMQENFASQPSTPDQIFQPSGTASYVVTGTPPAEVPNGAELASGNNYYTAPGELNLNPPAGTPTYPGTWWLASRTPLDSALAAALCSTTPVLTTSTNSAPLPASTSHLPAWLTISGFLAQSSQINTMDFYDPRGSTAGKDTAYGLQSASNWNYRFDVLPTSVELNYNASGSTPAHRKTYPALQLVNDASNNSPAGNNVFIAADATGWGVADSALFPLLDSNGNRLIDTHGTEYYGAIRIVDNNSAVNCNTAWARTCDLPWSNTTTLPALSDPPTGITSQLPNFGLFRSNVGLMELLCGSSTNSGSLTPNNVTALNEMQNLETARFGGASPAGDSVEPVDDNNVARTDFNLISAGDGMEMQLARRTLNPGQWLPVIGGAPASTASVFAPFSAAAAGDMAYRGCLLDPTAGTIDVENTLVNSMYRWSRNFAAVTNPYRSSLEFNFYPPLDPNGPSGSPAGNNYWFLNQFDQESGSIGTANPAGTNTDAQNNYRGLRGLLTTYSATSNYAPAHSMTGIANYVPLTTPAVLATPPVTYAAADSMLGTYATSTNADPVVPRVSINTAPFGALWRGFWNAMVEDNSSGTPLNPKAKNWQGTMFRDPIRNSSTDPFVANPNALGPCMAAIRSAVAAANAETLRRSQVPSAATPLPGVPDNSVPVHSFTLTVATGSQYKVTVYGTRRQPYITEVYVNDQTVTNQFIGVEIINPYAEAIDIRGWHVAYLTRGSTMQLTNIAQLDTTLGVTSLPAYSDWIFYDGTAEGTPSATDGATVKPIAGMAAAIGNELVFLRQAVDGGSTTLTPTDDGATPATTPDDSLAPIDSLDLSSVQVGNKYDYMRNTPGTAISATNNSSQMWQWVYPGLFSTGANPAPTGLIPYTGSTSGGNLGKIPKAATANTYYTVPVCLDGWPSPNPITATGPYKFPFGGFAHLSDIMQVPYFGAYKIEALTGATSLVEMNSVTTDCAFTDDGSTALATNPSQSVGRFCSERSIVGTSGAAAQSNYQWAEGVLQYFSTTENPNDDYTPAVPNPTSASNGGLTSVAGLQTYPGTPTPTNVPNGPVTTTATANQGNEDSVPIQGLININTAPWAVLNMLPLVVDPANGTVDTTIDSNNTITANNNETFQQLNAQLAWAIVEYRAQYGPFKTIFDLNQVPGFQNAMGAMPATPAPNTPITVTTWSAAQASAEGDLTYFLSGVFPTTLGSTTTPVLNDFRAAYYQIDRLSNLITTRSDTFTCYLLVQGWKNIGTANPEVVVEQRTAFIIDRTGLSNANNATNNLTVTTVNTN